MDTPLGVVNRALARCGQPPLNDAEEASPAGDYAREHADAVTRLILRRAPWNAGEKVSTVMARTDRTEADFKYVYDVPGGDAAAMRVWQVEPYGTIWRRRGRFLVADAGPSLTLTYTIFPPEEDWSEELRELVGLSLAKRIAPLFGRSASEQQQIREDIREATGTASMIDGGEQYPAFLTATAWTNARR